MVYDAPMRLYRFSAIVALALGLSACGGGPKSFSKSEASNDQAEIDQLLSEFEALGVSADVASEESASETLVDDGNETKQQSLKRCAQKARALIEKYSACLEQDCIVEGQRIRANPTLLRKLERLAEKAETATGTAPSIVPEAGSAIEIR